jgi:hypothetical protein
MQKDMQMDIDNIQKDCKERVDDLRTIIEDMQTDHRKKVDELYIIIDNMRSDHRKGVDTIQSNHRQLLAEIKTNYLWTVIWTNEKLKKKRTKIEIQNAAIIKLQRIVKSCKEL